MVIRTRLPALKRVTALSICGLLALPLVGAATADDCARPKVQKVETPNTVWQPGPNGRQVALWPDGHELELPDYAGHAEMIGSGSPLIAGRTWNWATYISRPTMTVFSAKTDNTGAAMLVLPGGGYAAIAMDLEGTEVCDWLTANGITCAVLKYRVPQQWQVADAGVQTPPDQLLALQDAQRAMSLLRQNASSYQIEDQKIGVIGFSAGAHLAAVLSNDQQRRYPQVDAVDELSSRPDFSVILYPGRFLAATPPGNPLKLAPWIEVDRAAPPTLLIHAMNDPVNDVRHSIAYGLALRDVGVAVDMRFYARGCHAFGLRPTSDPVTTQWPDQVLQWLQNTGVL